MLRDKTIFLVRHGQSWANIGDKTIVDAPLTEIGREQCAEVSLDVDYLICSPMRRTVETLHYSNINYPNIDFDPLFREKKCEISDHTLLEKYSPETEEEFYRRSRKMAQKLLRLLEKYDKIGVVCHGNVIYGLTGIMPDNADVIIPDINIIKLIRNGEHYFPYGEC